MQKKFLMYGFCSNWIAISSPGNDCSFWCEPGISVQKDISLDYFLFQGKRKSSLLVKFSSFRTVNTYFWRRCHLLCLVSSIWYCQFNSIKMESKVFQISGTLIRIYAPCLTLCVGHLYIGFEPWITRSRGWRSSWTSVLGHKDNPSGAC